MGDADNDKRITRRQAIVAGVAAASAASAAALFGTENEDQPMSETPAAARSARMPVVYLPHGGGPWPWVDLPMFDANERDDLAAYLSSVAEVPKQRPKALLVVSAHWEERVPTVMTSAQPPMLYDYYGFPPESYRITWPAPGSPELAGRVQSLLHGAGFESATDPARGFDHGTFVPLKLTYPAADVPAVQLSLIKGLDPERHIALGRALAPLRDEGIFIVGSGMSYHNLRNFGPGGAADSELFDAWLRETALLEQGERDRRLAQWQQAPRARAVHPREEHLLPLMVIAGAAGTDRATLAWNHTFGRVRLSAYHFS